MEPDANVWLGNYLRDACEGAAIEHLGMHRSGPGSDATRNLFALRRS
jgi:hypothetical protein